MKNQTTAISAVVAATLVSWAPCEAAEEAFNPYILRAVESLAASRPGLGYANKSYTQDLSFGEYTLKASGPPKTMCVAAQVEIIARAFEIYAAETKDNSIYKFLPIIQWRAVRPNSFRGKVWIADPKTSRGTAQALSDFGMGREMPFEKLAPGAFINLNRTGGSGHAVVFLGYIDKEGKLLPSHDASVAGFKYFSSQGKDVGGGFGYRYAFFNDAGCPTLSSDKKRDCGVIRSTNPALLDSGEMLMPKDWSKSRRATAIDRDANTPKGLAPGFNFTFFNGVTTDDD